LAFDRIAFLKALNYPDFPRIAGFLLEDCQKRVESSVRGLFLDRRNIENVEIEVFQKEDQEKRALLKADVAAEKPMLLCAKRLKMQNVPLKSHSN
jgi:hypothetical protein